MPFDLVVNRIHENRQSMAFQHPRATHEARTASTVEVRKNHVERPELPRQALLKKQTMVWMYSEGV